MNLTQKEKAINKKKGTHSSVIQKKVHAELMRLAGEERGNEGNSG